MDQAELAGRLSRLESEHGDLDAALSALIERGTGDQLQVARLKKRKLQLKDQINVLRDLLIPDIIA